MIRISKKEDINLINIQGYDAVYLLEILELTISKNKLKEEDLQKLMALKVSFSTGYKYASLDFELDKQNYLYILITTLIERKSLLTRDSLIDLFFENCNELIKEGRQKLLSYNGFSSDIEIQKKLAELNYYINTLYYVSHVKKLFKHDSVEHLIDVGVTLKEIKLITK